MNNAWLVLICLAVPLAAAGDRAVMVEVTDDGIFTVEMPFEIAPSAEAPEAPDADDLLWHYSQSTGLIQKNCPIGAMGEYVLTGGWYGAARMFEGLTGDGTVLWISEPELGPNEYWKYLATGTAAAWEEDVFFIVRTFEVWNDNGTPGDPNDDYLVSDNNIEVCLVSGPSPDPVWVWDGTDLFTANSVDEPGKCWTTPDGSVFALGGTVDGHTAVAVFEADSPDPVLVYENPGYTYAPRQLRLTADGSKLIFSVGATLFRVDVASGNLEDTFNLGASTDCFGVSADGSLVAHGFTSARLAVWDGSGYNLAWSYGVSSYYAGGAAVSDDNQTVYFGFYRNNYLQNRILRFDAGSSTPEWIYDTPMGSGSYQDVVSWMDCSSDGRWVALASWGCQVGGGDEVIVLDDEDPTEPVLSISAPGSMWHVDISPDGELVTAAGKHVHANEFGSGTDVYMAQITMTGIGPGIAAQNDLALTIRPNPCAGNTVFGFTLPEASVTELSLFDLGGRRVHHVVDSHLDAGTHSIPAGIDLPSGIYIVRLTAAGETVSGKLLVTR